MARLLWSGSSCLLLVAVLLWQASGGTAASSSDVQCTGESCKPPAGWTLMGLKAALLLFSLLLLQQLRYGTGSSRILAACWRHNLRPRAVMTGCALVAVTLCCVWLLSNHEHRQQAGVSIPQPPAPCPACPAADAANCEPALFAQHTELRGEEYHHSHAQAPEQCCALCTNNTKCAAFTYNSDEKFCRFKTAVQVLTSHVCHVCTSWRKYSPSTTLQPPDRLKPTTPPSGSKFSVLQPCAPRAPPAPKQSGNAACRDPAIKSLINEVEAAFDTTLAQKHSKDAHLAAGELTGTNYGVTDVMLIVGWQRPAFLMAALHQLLRADASEEHLYLFQLEYGYHDDVLAVACAWPLPSRIVFTPAHAPGSDGPGYTPGHWNSFTVLEGYRQAEMIAREFCSKLVYMLEEDIFVAPDFFLFHRAAQTHAVKGLSEGERAQIFAVTAYNSEHDHDHCDGQLGEEKLRKVHSSVFTRQFYHSLGVSIPVAMLPVVTQHANLQFYNQPAAYNEREFGTVRIYGNTEDLAPAVETEQDALIGKREYTVKNLRTLMPYCSRAYHAGFVGYNRESSKSKSRDDSHLQGETLSQRVATLMTMNQDEMNADTPIKDIVQIPKPIMERGYAWKAEELHCGFALREDEPEVWRGSKCDLAASCECHHFGGGWGLKDGNV